MIRKLTQAMLLTIVLAIGVVSLPTGEAHAWSWSSTVTLKGRIQCPAWGGPYDRVQWAWLDGANGDYGWLKLSGSGRVLNHEKWMSRVPLKGERVTISYGCSASGKHSTRLTVPRPAVGSTYVRNIY